MVIAMATAMNDRERERLDDMAGGGCTSFDIDRIFPFTFTSLLPLSFTSW